VNTAHLLLEEIQCNLEEIKDEEINEIIDPISAVGIGVLIAGIFATAGYFKGRRDLAVDVIFDKYKKQAQEADDNAMAAIGMVPAGDRTFKIFDSRKKFVTLVKKVARFFSIIQRGGRQELIQDARLAFISYLEISLDLYKKELPSGQKSLVKTVKSGLKSLN